MGRVTALVTVVLGGFLACACEPEDRGCAASVAVSIDGSKRVNALTPIEAVQICQARYAAEAEVCGEEEYCLRKAVAFKEMSHGDEAACEAEYETCLAVPRMNQDRCQPAEVQAEAAACDATVAEVVACLEDGLETRCRFYSDLSCDASDGEGLTDPEDKPKSCHAIEEHCPMVAGAWTF